MCFRTANAKRYLNQGLSDTNAIQTAINSGKPKVLIPDIKRPWVVGPIELQSNQEIIFKKGVVVEAMKGAFRILGDDWNTATNRHRRGDSLLWAICKENIRLNGYGATLRMQKAEYMAEDNISEHRHVLEFKSCSNIIIEGLTLADSGGDGIFLGRYHQYAGVKYYCENVTIEDVCCDNNLRSGVAVISVDGLTIENCVLKNTIGTWPQCGIVFEPNYAAERLTGIVMRNNTLSNNRSIGLIISLHALTAATAELDIMADGLLLFDDTIHRPTAYAGICINSTGDPAGPQGKITLKDVVSRIERPGLLIEKDINPYEIVQIDCQFAAQEVNNE